MSELKLVWAGTALGQNCELDKMVLQLPSPLFLGLSKTRSDASLLGVQYKLSLTPALL